MPIKFLINDDNFIMIIILKNICTLFLSTNFYKTLFIITLYSLFMNEKWKKSKLKSDSHHLMLQLLYKIEGTNGQNIKEKNKNKKKKGI